MEDTVPLTDVRRRILQDIWNPRLDRKNVKILLDYLHRVIVWSPKDEWGDINKLFEEEL